MTVKVPRSSGVGVQIQKALGAKGLTVLDVRTLSKTDRLKLRHDAIAANKQARVAKPVTLK